MLISGMRSMVPLLFLVLSLVSAEAVVAQAAVGEGEEANQKLAGEVLRIFEVSCAECHDESRGKPDGDFGFVLDLERLAADPDYIVRGDPDSSEIYLLMIDPDEEFVMPPPKSEVHKPTEKEMLMVRDWIAVGAPAPEPPSAEISPTPTPEPVKRPFSWNRLIAHSHPLVVHFPVAMLLGALLAEFLSLGGRWFSWANGATRFCLWVGFLGAVASVISGWINADMSGKDADLHRWMGVTTAVLGFIAVVFYELVRPQKSARRKVAFFVLLVVMAIIVSITGHTGGELVYGKDYFKFF